MSTRTGDAKSDFRNPSSGDSHRRFFLETGTIRGPFQPLRGIGQGGQNASLKFRRSSAKQPETLRHFWWGKARKSLKNAVWSSIGVPMAPFDSRRSLMAERHFYVR